MGPTQGPLVPLSARWPCPRGQQVAPRDKLAIFHFITGAPTTAVWLLGPGHCPWKDVPLESQCWEQEGRARQSESKLLESMRALRSGGEAPCTMKSHILEFSIDPVLSPGVPSCRSLASPDAPATQGLLSPCLCPRSAVSPSPVDTARRLLCLWGLEVCTWLALRHVSVVWRTGRFAAGRRCLLINCQERRLPIGGVVLFSKASC